MKTARTRAAGYIRVSDESQVEGHSLDAQRREITRYCKSRGYELVRIYVDAGVSAYTEHIEDRPEFAELLRDAERDLYDVVVVHTVDRWARRVSVQAQSLDRLSKAGVDFESVMENIDRATPIGRLLQTFLGGASEYSSAQLGVHVSKSQRERAELGLPVGPVPFGYVQQNPKQAPEPVPAEADAVRQAFELRLRKESHGFIAARLNDRGFQTRTGRMFTEYAVRDMLSAQFYTGVIPYRQQDYPGQHQAIIPHELFEQVQLLRNRHGRKNIRGGITGALQGILFCGHCGNPIHSERNHQGDPRYRERHGWPCITNGRSVIAHRIDPQIGDILGSLDLAPEWREKILRLAIKGRPELDLTALKRQRQRVARAYGDGAYTEEEYERRLDEIDAKLQVAIPVMLPSIEEAAGLIDDIPSIWREALPEERRKLVAPLVEQVYLDLAAKRVTAIKPKPGFGELLAHAIRHATTSSCLLLSQEEMKELQNVGLVETGEGRTPRPKGPLVKYTTSLSGSLISPSGASTGGNILKASR